MHFEFSGAYALPGIQAAQETVENLFWWGRFENQLWSNAPISGAARDAGNTDTTILRPGLPLGLITASNLLKEWNPTGTDGSQNVWGILGHAVKMQSNSANVDRFMGGIMVSGFVKPDRLLIPGEASFGISGNAVEHLLRAQLFPRILCSDNAFNSNGFGTWHTVLAKTADFTITEAMNNTLFTNRGAVGAVIFTLPATAKKGLRYGFHVVADQTVTITAGTADTLIGLNDATADSVALSTASEKIGGHFEVMGDGTGWLVVPHLWEAQTATLAT